VEFLMPHSLATARHQEAGRRHAQRGISLLFALLALVALSLASVALVQSIGTGASIIGNLGLKQDATAAAEQVTRQAITAMYAKLSTSTNSLDGDVPALGYYASSTALDDVTGSQLAGNAARNLVNWQNNCDGAPVGNCFYTSVAVSSAVNGNTAQYAIFRLCDAIGDPTVTVAISCARPPVATATTGTNKGALNYAQPGSNDSSSTPYYRIVVRVAGARNTVSFTETIVHF
jgi:type IV pilus assembly protein PilX